MSKKGIAISPEPAVSHAEPIAPSAVHGGVLVTPGTARLTLTTFPPEVVVGPYEVGLIYKAEKMHGQREYGLAVIAAHIACEIAATHAFSASLKEQRLESLDDPLSDLLNGFNLANERNRNLFCAVTNLEIHAQPFWPAFKASAKLRNELIHTIHTANEVESRASIDAAKQLVLFLLGQIQQ